MRGPRSVRARLLVTVMAATAVITAIATVAFALALAHALSDDADDVARLKTTRELAKVHVVRGQIAVPLASLLENNAWVVQSGQVVAGPSDNPELARAVLPFVRMNTDFVDVPGQETRLHAAAIKDKYGTEVGTLVVGMSLAPFHGTQEASLTIWLISAGVLLVAVFFTSRWLVDSTLRPVARMTADAQAWSASGALQRFARGEPTDELDDLAFTLDGLLDRLAASLRREQLFSAELSHELRTPLSRLCAEAEIALRSEREVTRYRAALRSILDDGRRMAGIVDTLMIAARAEASSARGTSDPGEVLSDVADDCAEIATTRGVTTRIVGPREPLRLGVEAGFAVRVVRPLAENAYTYARTTVRFEVRREGSSAAIVVADDGPGVPADEAQLVFEPGKRGKAADAHDAPAGAGLGLALSRRLARAVSGDVNVERGQGGRFVVRLPLAPPL